MGGGLFTPRKDRSGNLKHSACVVIDDPREVKKIEAARDAAIAEKFPSGFPKRGVDWTIREGDEEEFEASFGHMFINPKSTKPVGIGTRVDGKFERIDQESGIIYPGCYVFISVEAYGYKGEDGAGVTLGLQGVCFFKDGEPLGPRFDETDFDGCESEVDSSSYEAEAPAEASSLLS